MSSENYFITETKTLREEIVYGKTRIGIEFQLKAVAEKDGRMLLASTKPVKVEVNGEEIDLLECEEE